MRLKKLVREGKLSVSPPILLSSRITPKSFIAKKLLFRQFLHIFYTTGVGIIINPDANHWQKKSVFRVDKNTREFGQICEKLSKLWAIQFSLNFTA
jgi:hypothetical protein